MGRLFDAGKEEREAEESRRTRTDVRRRAEEAERIINETLELDEATKALGEKLSVTQAVKPIHYVGYRAPGSKWNIEHAQVGADYVYQLFPLRPTLISWKDVIAQFIRAMDVIFPRSISIRYVPPSERFQLKYYTIRVESVADLPGWEGATVDRALKGLSMVDAWPRPEEQN